MEEVTKTVQSSRLLMLPEKLKNINHSELLKYYQAVNATQIDEKDLLCLFQIFMMIFKAKY